MAETLQRSLLPAGRPEVDGLEVVTRYLPAVRGTAAGGDWYDLHRLPTGPCAGIGPVVCGLRHRRCRGYRAPGRTGT
jgi:hypothetical protein